MFVEVAKTAKQNLYRVVLLHLVPSVAKAFGCEVVHFLHVGKTGGTAVKEAFSAYPFPWRRFGPLIILFHGHRTALQDLPSDDRFFVFFRDPVARFVSGFNSRKRRGRPRRFVPWSRAERHAFERFGSAGELADGLLANDPQSYQDAIQAMGAIEHVGSLQISWIGGSVQGLEENRDRLVVLGRQETLQRDFDRLKATLGLPDSIALPGSGRTAHRSQTSDALNDRQAAAIKDWYERDYALLTWVDEVGPRLRSATSE